MCAERENERERKEPRRWMTVRDRDESRGLPVKSIRDTLVEVYILVRHEQKAIRMAVVFNLCFSHRDLLLSEIFKKKSTRELKDYIDVICDAVLISISLASLALILYSVACTKSEANQTKRLIFD